MVILNHKFYINFKKMIIVSIIVFLIVNFSLARNLIGREVYSTPDNETFSYIKVSEENLKNYLLDEKIYVIDTRKLSKSASGYIKNTILLPKSMFSFIFSIVPIGSEIIIVTDEENKQITIESLIELYSYAYKFIGYALFSEITSKNAFDLQVVEFNPNSNENIQQIIEKNENIIDIREINEFKKTGYVKNSILIPLSNFLTNYNEIPTQGDVYIFCQSGTRSLIGMTFLRRKGYKNRFIIMKGGINRAIEEGFPLISYE